MNRYSPTEFWKNVYSLITTKMFFKRARLVRRPIYIRGKKSIVGARNLTTGRFCRFDLNGRKETLFIGDNCEIGDNTHIVALDKVEIGDNVLIASKVFISDTSHGIYRGECSSSPYTSPNERKLVSKSVKIGNNVWIGENVVILSGVTIGDGCVIGANSVVTKNIESYTIAVGVPAQIVKIYDLQSQQWENSQR